jgi:prepilin-type N-terminal cleavage/methylation domain-containing protein
VRFSRKPGVVGKGRQPLFAGMSLLEMLIAIALILVMATIAMPYLFGNRRAYHLTQAATAVTGAIQATRYNAIMTGCPYTLNFTQGTTTYQVQTKSLTGTPPACAAGWSNVGSATPWSTSGDVSVNATTTLHFCPNGTLTSDTCPGTVAGSAFILSNGFTTNTITVSGVGNVNVHTP